LFSIDQFLFEFSKKNHQQKKTREFLQQLKERKKLSLFYGHLTRKQLVNLFHQVGQEKGKTVFSLLERRLDIVLYRSGITKTVKQARQLIKHKKIQVNQNFLTIPSSRVNPGDLISIEAGQSLKQKLLKLENLKSRPKVFGDFYSKLEKIQSQPQISPKSSKIVSTPQIKSKLFCKLLAQLISTRILLRCFLELKKNYLITSNFKKFKEKTIYTLLKARSRALAQRARNVINKKHYQSKLKNGKLANLYANNGSLQKKPQFCKLFFYQKKAFNYSNLERPILKAYRTSFLTFFKFLKKDARFQKLLLLSMKKSFSLSKKHLIKPLHLETSYNLLNVIYLYSPQRVNFPFFIDLDLINRSLR